MSSAVKVIEDVLMAVYVRNDTRATRKGTRVIADLIIKALVDDGWSLVKPDRGLVSIENLPVPRDLPR